MISAKVIRPGPVIVVKRVAHAREQAQREPYDRLAVAFTPKRCAALDGLLVADSGDRHDQAAVVGEGPGGVLTGSGPGRGREVGVLARARHARAGPVGAAGRAAPVPALIRYVLDAVVTAARTATDLRLDPDEIRAAGGRRLEVTESR